jgi:DNA-binding response OmpR family regulator
MVSNLRRKLAAAAAEPAGPAPAPDQPIETVTGVGYRLLERG